MTRRWLLLVLLAACGGGDRPIEWSLPDDAFWPDPRQYPGVGAGRIIVTNNLSDTVSILDLAALDSGQLTEIGRIPVGFNPLNREGPHHLTVDPAGRYYYVGISNFVPAGGSGPHANHGSSTTPGHILRIRSSDNVMDGSVRVEDNPGDVRMSPDGKILLVSHFDTARIAEHAEHAETQPDLLDSFLVLVDPATLQRSATIRLCPAAHGIGVSPDSKTAYVSCFDDRMAVVDLADAAHPVTLLPVIASPGTVLVPSCEPYAMSVAPDGGSVWVSCFNDGRVVRYDTAQGAMDPAVVLDVGGRAVFGAFTADGKTLFLAHQDPDGIAAIDAATKTVTANLPFDPSVCQNAHGVKLTEGDRHMLVVCEGDHSRPGSLVLVDPATRQVQTSVALGVYPDDVQVLR
jgi:DNA-binding beta-propeller fold protein YncE